MPTTFPKPFSTDILDSTSTGRSLITAASAAAARSTLAAAGTGVANTFSLAQQFDAGFNVGTVSTSIKSTTIKTNTTNLDWYEAVGWVSAGIDSYPIHQQGFNILPTGRPQSGMTAIWTTHEHNYNDPTEGMLSEWHLNYQNASGASSRAIFVKFHRDAYSQYAAGEASIELRGETIFGNTAGSARMTIPINPASPITVTSGPGFQVNTNNVFALTQKRTDADYESLIYLGNDNRVKIAGSFNVGADLPGSVTFSGMGSVNSATSRWVMANNISFGGFHSDGTTFSQLLKIDSSNFPRLGVAGNQLYIDTTTDQSRTGTESTCRGLTFTSTAAGGSIYADLCVLNITPTAANGGYVASRATAAFMSGSIPSTITGFRGEANAQAAGEVTVGYCFDAQAIAITSATARFATLYNYRAREVFLASGGTVGTVYGFYCDDLNSGGVANVALRTGRGDTILGEHASARIGFFNTAPVTKETGVAVSAAGVHAALVRLGLIGV